MNLSPETKIAGLLTPLFALRREHDLGIGDVGALREFIQWAHENGFRLVQMLPTNEVGHDNSPYNAISSMALEPTTLLLEPGSPPELTHADYQSVTADVDLGALRRGGVKYNRVRKLKRSLLERACSHFEIHGSAARWQKFDDFLNRAAEWLAPYTFFRALMELNNDSEAWPAWPEEQRHPQTARSWLEAQPPEIRAEFATREKFFAYVQFVADEQWRAMKEFAGQKGVALMGDIPFGVSFCSADVYTHREIFHLEWSGGAPPEPYFKDDAFTQKWGQNWGIPIYNWDALRAEDFAWWRRRVRGVQRKTHLFRIDHVLGFYRIYSFPWRPAENADFLPLDWEQMLQVTGGRAPHFIPRADDSYENCAENQRAGEEYLRMIVTEHAGVVGEDLGTVPDYVRPSLRQLGIAGFKIPQWETPGGWLTPGNEYERLSVATYATHDHKPLREVWAEAYDENSPTRDQAREELRTIAAFAGFAPREGLEYERDFFPAIMSALFMSNSWIAVVMITDALARRDRFNVPGVAGHENWTRRLPKSVSQMQHSRSVRHRMRVLRELLAKSGRTPAPES
ncbi:MAG: 4-alpha-glucanotransferase [Verrucomicrobiota bacterium]|nr:4-alpha-glucanotransferase [Verrucomicrobiota bacterium]